MNEYPNKFALEEMNEYFCKWIYSSKIFEYIGISDYLRKIVLGLFWPFSYYVLFWIQIEPVWTNNNHF